MKTYWCKWRSGDREMLAEWQAEDETDLGNQIAQHKGKLVEIVDVIEGTKEEQAAAFLKKGHSIDDPIKIHCDNGMGVTHEYLYLKTIFEHRKMSYKMIGQELIFENNRHYDKLTVELSDGSAEDFYFDITLFLGKDVDLKTGLSRDIT